MSHLVLTSYFISLILGFITLGVVVSISIKSMNKDLIVYLIFFSAMTLDFIIETINRYLYLNSYDFYKSIEMELEIVIVVSRYTLLFSLSLFVFHIFLNSSIKSNFIRSIKIILISIFLNILLMISNVVTASSVPPSEAIYLIGVLGLVLYSIIRTCFFKRNEIVVKNNKHEFLFLKRVLVLYSLSLPLILNDDLSIISLPFKVSPFSYMIFSYLVFKHFYNFHLNMYNSRKSRDVFIKKHNITSREKETLDLVIKGLSNKEISEKLNISIPTVKAHIYKIYKKSGVKARFELISMLK